MFARKTFRFIATAGLEWFAFSAAILALSAALSACADLPSKPSHDKSKRASSLISKTTWMDVLPGVMSDEFCDPESELLRCYPLSHDECRQNIEQITVSCANNYSAEIPAKLGRADAANWGGTIGNCTKNGVLQLIQSKNLTAANDACRQIVEEM